ncbi:hypothetical protein G7047_07320 [Diaphorobacter sp. HDW4A]|nr:hypothetical protein [Diaphorobacter sp. HDW4A]QIL79733.1 hypothetical protein G7047_07320 [Diaphorobacter sp. HDW4A]
MTKGSIGHLWEVCLFGSLHDATGRIVALQGGRMTQMCHKLDFLLFVPG